MSFSLGSILPSGLAFLGPVVQDNTLAREFRDALYPQILFRAEALPEKWAINVGDTQVETRASLLAPATRPLTAGEDPTPKLPSYEQWSVRAEQYGDAMDTNMATSRTALASLFARNAKTLGLQAGQSLNRVPRNKLFCAYLGGDTVAGNSATGTVLEVGSIAGFTQTLVNGELVSISVTNPKVITISGVAGTVNVTAATPQFAADPLGPGTLTLGTSKTFVAGARVKASDAPTILRSGGGATIDALTAASALTLADVRAAVAVMQRNRVPTHEDGLYHLHLDPLGVNQLMADNELQRMFQSRGIPDGPWRDYALGVALGCLFISNNEAPNAFTSGTLAQSRAWAGSGTGDADAMYSPEYFAEVRNASGVAVLRSIVTGGGSIMEKWIDESAEYMSDAGVNGKIGEFSVVNNGIQVSIDRVRYILRAPQDRLQQIVSQAWSFSGDWGIPSDFGGGLTGSRFKRAVVIESGSAD